MRIRKKPNLMPRMERCARVQIKQPAALRGSWLKNHPAYNQLWAELGCGKGRFTSDMAEQNPEKLLVAIELVPDAMVMAMERACSNNLENVLFIEGDAVSLPVIFDAGEVDRIFINFCDPWPKKRDAKRRLTSPAFLSIYKSILKADGEIHFKTDNKGLFDYSLESFSENGWTLSQLTRDLHSGGVKGIMTDYEAKFFEMGVPINRFVAKKGVV